MARKLAQARGVRRESPQHGAVAVPLAGDHPVARATPPKSSFDGLQITHLVESALPMPCEACGVQLDGQLICPLCSADHSLQCSACRRRAYHLQGCPGQAADRDGAAGGRSGRLAAVLAPLLLLIPSCLIGCREESEEWHEVAPATQYQANGFTFSFYGPRASGYAPDAAPSIEAGLVTVDEIGAALEARARELAARAPVQPEVAVATMRSLEIRIVDDYNFAYGDVWAAGLRHGNLIIVALWARREAAAVEGIPIAAPQWTVRSPDFENVNWRYGGRDRLVAAGDHELGHFFFGPHFEH